VFGQMNITDPNERNNIALDIATRLNTGNPLSSSYSKSDTANSAKYRADIRAILIDVITELLYIRNLQTEANDLEANSRDSIRYASNRVDKILSKLHAMGSNVLETFEEGLVSGRFSGTLIRDGKLRLDEAQITAAMKSIDILKVIPAESVANNTKVVITGDPNVLGVRGTGSDTLWIESITPRRIELNWMDRPYWDSSLQYPGSSIRVQGLLIAIDIELHDAITPAAITVKGTDDIRLFRVYAGDSLGGTRLLASNGNPVEDVTASNTSYVDDIVLSADSVYSKFKLLLNVPYPFKEIDGKQVYKIGLHNIKISPEITSDLISGSFSTFPFIANNLSLFKAKLYAKQKLYPASFAEYSLCFYIGRLKQEIAILPKRTQKVYSQLTSDSEGKFNLPFPLISGPSASEMTIWTDENVEITDTITLDENGYTLQLENYVDTTVLFDYWTFPYTSYTGDNVTAEHWTSQDDVPIIQRTPPSSNPEKMLGVDEGIFAGTYLNKVHHDKADGRVFPLDRVPHIDVRVMEGHSTFVFEVNDVVIEIEDITPYLNPLNTIIFDEDETKLQFYYKDRRIYTSFNMLDLDAYSTANVVNTFTSINSIIVKYATKADSVSLTVKLYGEGPLIDMYNLELIGLDLGLESTSTLSVGADPGMTTVSGDY